jgi:hypothetical protein
LTNTSILRTELPIAPSLFSRFDALGFVSAFSFSLSLARRRTIVVRQAEQGAKAAVEAARAKADQERMAAAKSDRIKAEETKAAGATAAAEEAQRPKNLAALTVTPFCLVFTRVRKVLIADPA